MRVKLLRVVLTGGPCGGKTSSLRQLQDTLSSKGFEVYAVPEVPTILINGGAKYPGEDGGDKLIAFETELIRMQIAMENSFEGIARSTGKPSVIILDRGLMDVGAYLPQAQWHQVLRANGWTEENFLARYDCVVHLTTTADGAEEFYTTANNTARTETPEEALQLDKRIMQAWKGHAELAVIRNEGSFQDKLSKATQAVLAVAERAPTASL